MKMNITIADAIKMIVRLYMPLSGYWVDEIENDPMVKMLVKAEYVSLDDEHNNKYVINAKGKDFFHLYIEQISLDFINFMKGNMMSCSTPEIIQWYMQKYNLTDIDIAEDITEYIRLNLNTYGYNATTFHSAKIENGIQIEKL